MIIHGTPQIEEQLCAHKGSLNVVYTQALADVESGLLQASNDTRRHLASLQARGAKAEYMETARALKDYGHLHFMPCLCDYPATNSRYKILLISLYLLVNDEKSQIKCRMQFWNLDSRLSFNNREYAKHFN